MCVYIYISLFVFFQLSSVGIELTPLANQKQQSTLSQRIDKPITHNMLKPRANSSKSAHSSSSRKLAQSQTVKDSQQPNPLGDIGHKHFANYTNNKIMTNDRTVKNTGESEAEVTSKIHSMLPSKELPWIYRYKIKRKMNQLSRIMASRPPVSPVTSQEESQPRILSDFSGNTVSGLFPGF